MTGKYRAKDLERGMYGLDCQQATERVQCIPTQSSDSGEWKGYSNPHKQT